MPSRTGFRTLIAAFILLLGAFLYLSRGTGISPPPSVPFMPAPSPVVAEETQSPEPEPGPEDRVPDRPAALVPTSSLEGHVENTEGLPVEGAMVFSRSYTVGDTSHYPPQDEQIATSVMTDEAGRFLLADLPQGKHKLSVTDEGYATLISEPIVHDAKDTVLVLQGSGGASGRVVDAATGKPMPGLRVWVTDQPRVDFFETSDRAGNFRFTGLSVGRHTIQLADDTLVGYPPSLAFQVREGEETRGLEVKVGKPGSISGRVYDADTGEGIGGIRIAWSDGGKHHWDRAPVLSSDTGFYRIPKLTAGLYEVWRDDAADYPAPTNRERRRAQVTLGENTPDINFPLSQGLTISGTVHDEAGQPVFRASIKASWGREGNRRDASSQFDGSFRLSGLRETEALQLEASLKGYGPFRSSGLREMEALRLGASLKGYGPASMGPFPLHESLEGVDIVLPAECVITGTVVDTRNDPVPDAEVRLLTHVSPTMRVQLNAKANVFGSFRFDGLAPGEGELYATRSGYEPLHFNLIEEKTHVELAPGQHVSGLRLLFHESGSLSITGRVIDDLGNAMEGARVTAYAQDASESSATSDKDGAFELRRLDDVVYDLRASLNRNSMAESVQAPAGATHVELVLPRTGAIEGRVVDAATGRPITNFTCAAYPAAHVGILAPRLGNSDTSYDPEGRFRLEDVQARETTLYARALGCATGSVHVPKVSPGETVTGIVVALENGHELRGIVVDGAGNPISGASISDRPEVQSFWPGQHAMTQTDRTGRFRIADLGAGRFTLHVRADGFAPSVAEARLPAPREIRIVMGQGGGLEGVVTVDGTAAKGCMVALYGQDGGNSAITDESGYYQILELTPGAVHAICLAPKRERRKEAEAEVFEGGITELNFDLTKDDVEEDPPGQ